MVGFRHDCNVEMHLICRLILLFAQKARKIQLGVNKFMPANYLLDFIGPLRLSARYLMAL